jgi:hypothetical protein
MTCFLSSISRARFVTAGAIDLKFCTYVPLDEHHLGFYQISAQSDFKYGRQVTILENQLKS